MSEYTRDQIIEALEGTYTPEAWEALCRERLAITYTPKGVDHYMHARIRSLDGVPLDLIRDGQGARVLDVIERIEGGGW